MNNISPNTVKKHSDSGSVTPKKNELRSKYRLFFWNIMRNFAANFPLY